MFFTTALSSFTTNAHIY